MKECEIEIEDWMFDNVVRNINKLNDSPEGLKSFKEFIHYMGDRLTILASLYISLDDGIQHASNLAGMLAWNNKMQHLNILLEQRPHLMWQRCLPNDITPLITPLDAAVHYRKPALVRTILSHPILTQYAQDDKDNYVSLVSNSLRIAQKWFGNSAKADELDIIRQLEEGGAKSL